MALCHPFRQEIWTMPTVKIGASRQVVIPKAIHDELGLTPGDYLGVQLRDGQVIFTPQALVDRRLKEGLEDLCHGRVHGPYASTEEMLRALKDRAPVKRPRRA
jgi:AbrB family looped-hinge helix DNA binding protein